MRLIGPAVVLALSLFVAPLAAAAQQAGKIPRIGMIVPGSASSFAPRTAAFRQGLRELGYVEGRNIIVEYRLADGRPERFRALADELVRLEVRVIVTLGTPATLAAKEASKTVPIVMANVGEAVDLGIVASLAHPGGNVTGSSYLMLDLVIKRLEALKEMLPNATQAAVLSNPINPFCFSCLSFGPTSSTGDVRAISH